MREELVRVFDVAIRAATNDQTRKFARFEEEYRQRFVPPVEGCRKDDTSQSTSSSERVWAADIQDGAGSTAVSMFFVGKSCAGLASSYFNMRDDTIRVTCLAIESVGTRMKSDISL